MYRKKLHDDGREYGKYKVKPNTTISVEDLQNALDNKPLSYGHVPHWIEPLRDKSFVSFVYWVGARKMEPTKVLKEDIVIVGDYLVVKIPAFKHGERAGPLKIKCSNIGIDWVVKVWEKTRPKHQVWQLTASTAYRIIFRALGKCPHWLRHNWISTKQRTLAGEPAEVDAKIQSWTGIKHRATLDNYRLKLEKDIEDIAELEE